MSNLNIIWNSQTPVFNTSSDDVKPKITIDPKGDILVAFYYLPPSTANQISGGSAAGRIDIVIFKLDGTTGIHIWNSQFPSVNTSGNELVPDIDTDSSGNVIVTGSTNSIISGGSRFSGSDVFVYKLDGTNGKLIWSKQTPTLNSPGNESNPSIAIDSQDNIVIAYNILSSVGHSISGGSSAGSRDVVVFKLDNLTGTQQWSTQVPVFNVQLQDDVPSLAIDSKNNIIVGKQVGIAAVSGGIFSGGTEIALFKLSSNGTHIWNSQYPTFNSTGNETMPSICVDSDDNIIMSFTTNGTISGGSLNQNSDIAVAKISGINGIPIWTKSSPVFNTPNDDIRSTVKVDSADHPTVVYFVNNGTDPAVSGGSSAGGKEIVLFKLDRDGTHVWNSQKRIMNTSGNEEDPDIEIHDQTNDIVICYSTTGTLFGGSLFNDSIDITVVRMGFDCSQISISLQYPTRVCHKSPLLVTPTITGGSGPQSFYWTGPASFTSNDSILQIPYMHPLNEGTYWVTATDFPCTIVDNFFVSVVDLDNHINSEIPSCVGSQISIRTTGGSGTYSYHWLGPNFDFHGSVFDITSALSSGPYFVTTADNIYGCTIMDWLEVTVVDLQLIIGSNSPVCLGNKLYLEADTRGGSDSYSYLWVGPNSFSSQIQNPSICDVVHNNFGTYLVTTIDNQFGCQVWDSLQVTGIDISLNINSNSPICIDSDIILTPDILGGSGLYEYKWQGPRNFTHTARDVIRPGTIDAQGTYLLTIQDTRYGCLEYQNSYVSVIDLEVDLIVPRYACNGKSVPISATGKNGSGIYSYQWTGPNFSSTLKDNTVPIMVNSEGYYWVSVKDNIIGCTISENAFVSVIDLQLGISSNSPICIGSEISLYSRISGGTNNYCYQWSGPNSFQSSIQDNSIPTADTPNDGVYYLTVTDKTANCSVWDFTHVSVIDLHATVQSNSPVCNNQELQLNTQITGGSGQYQYVWYGPNNFRESTSDPTTTVTPQNRGNYLLTVSDSQFGCFAYQNTFVSVIDLQTQITGLYFACNGTSFQLTADVSGGSNQYIYRWLGPNLTSSDPMPVIQITNASHGPYFLTISDGLYNCIAYDNSYLTVIDLIVDVRPIFPPCKDNIFQLNSTVSGGSDNYSYQWTGPRNFTSDSISPMVTASECGKYWVTVIDRTYGCTNTDCNYVTVIDLDIAVTSNSPVCNNQELQLGAQVTGGSNQYQYEWSGPNNFLQTAQDPTTLVTPQNRGTYWVTVTDNVYGCTISQNTFVSVIDLQTQITSSNITCNGSTYQLKADISGGSGQYSYDWLGPNLTSQESMPTTQITTTNQGYYFLTVTDDRFTCAAHDTSYLTVIDLVVDIQSVFPPCLNSMFTLNADIFGGGNNYSYKWTGPNNFTSTKVSSTVIATTSGKYWLTVEDQIHGCQAIDCEFVTVIDLQVRVPDIFPPCLGRTFRLNVDVSGGSGNYGYEWVGMGITTPAVQSPNVVATQSGPYLVTVTDLVYGCHNSDSTIVTVIDLHANIRGDSRICDGSTLNLTVDVSGGSNKYAYQWIGPDSFMENGMGIIRTVDTNSSGTYHVSVTDNTYSCTTYDSLDVVVISLTLDISSNSPVCIGTDINLISQVGGGSGNYSYLWTGPNSFQSTAQDTSAIATQSGNYNLQVEDTIEGCMISDSVYVSVIDIRVNIMAPPAECIDNTFILTPVVSGGSDNYSYMWIGPNFSSQAMQPTATARDSGKYFVSINDNVFGCFESACAYVSVIDLTMDVSSNSPVCSDGLLSLYSHVTGSHGYSYVWSGPGFSSTESNPQFRVTDSNQGRYFLTVEDRFGCMVSDNIFVTVTELKVIVSPTPTPSPCVGTEIAITSSVTGGSGNYQYQWIGPDYNGTNSVADFVVQNSGYYNLSVADRVFGCTVWDSTYVSVIDLMITLTDNSPICVGDPISIQSKVMDGSDKYTYTWNGPDGFQSSLPNVSRTAQLSHTGRYWLTVGDSMFSCSIIDFADIEVSEIVVDVSSNSPIQVGNTIQLSSQITGGTGTITYQWKGPYFMSTVSDPLIPNATTQQSGSYHLTVRDENECRFSAATLVRVLDIIANAYSNTPVRVNTQLELYGSGTGGDSPYSYFWIGPKCVFTSTEQNPIIPQASMSDHGTYHLTVIDNNGFRDSTITDVKVFSPPVITPCPSDRVPYCTEVTLKATGCVSYVWSTGETTSDITYIALVPKTFTVTGTDSNGCIETDAVAIKIIFDFEAYYTYICTILYNWILLAIQIYQKQKQCFQDIKSLHTVICHGLQDLNKILCQIRNIINLLQEDITNEEVILTQNEVLKQMIVETKAIKKIYLLGKIRYLEIVKVENCNKYGICRIAYSL